MSGVLDRGPRFCKENQHFLVRNKVIIPYSYFILVIMKTNKTKSINNDSYDPDAFYRIKGATVLHSTVNNYKVFEFILNKY